VACGHNIASIRATYWWEGEIHDDPQARVALLTRAELRRRSSPEPTAITPTTSLA
jgi:uncharacterized protein involved in tolerance to divalent cations